jgi:hypothetical protein
MIVIFYNLRENERLVRSDGYWQFVVLVHAASLQELIAEHSHAPGNESSPVARVRLPTAMAHIRFFATLLWAAIKVRKEWKYVYLQLAWLQYFFSDAADCSLPK